MKVDSNFEINVRVGYVLYGVIKSIGLEFLYSIIYKHSCRKVETLILDSLWLGLICLFGLISGNYTLKIKVLFKLNFILFLEKLYACPTLFLDHVFYLEHFLSLIQAFSSF